ncbi:hypothetical protein Rxycam_01573 [Rubrobacter xylanophilus DSM 9941]|uniref:glycosyltransferase n=1 Tax=Rubrobacter xylanophilus TaxID=49319 RepID=UPI001C63EAFD|nr:glycosyltransferase [Rubrobacter xylanophilus]QYJ15745.1 hypothetical protein Rxycam_01573 [Rubrobacter xylanophilus DSM 9941]
MLLAGVRWDFLWQRHQILATLFARAGYPTVFVETTGLRNPRPGPDFLVKAASRLRRAVRRRKPPSCGPAVYPPLVAPPTLRVFRALNRRLLVPRAAREILALSGPDPVVVAYPPTQTTLDFLRELRPRLVLYDCSEEYAGIPGVPWDIERTERRLLERADLVSCTSGPLLERVRRVRPDAFLSGPGVDPDLFEPLSRESPSPSGRVRTVGYFGHLSRERTDFAALRRIAAAGFRVRLVGGLGEVEREFLKTPGIDYRGEVAHRELPEALAGVDALVLPYLVNRLTRGIAPAKLYECLATGLPVVGPPLPVLAGLGGHVYLAESPEEYVAVLRGLPGLESGERRRARMELARRNTWERRFAELEAALWSRL